jgi:hypothetical protein
MSAIFVKLYEFIHIFDWLEKCVTILKICKKKNQRNYLKLLHCYKKINWKEYINTKYVSSFIFLWKVVEKSLKQLCS